MELIHLFNGSNGARKKGKMDEIEMPMRGERKNEMRVLNKGKRCNK